MMKNQYKGLSNKDLFRQISRKSKHGKPVIGQFSGMTYGGLLPEIVLQEHSWVTVINPRNNRTILQACDDCGVVKSENSIVKNCRATPGQAVISNYLELSKTTLM